MKYKALRRALWFGVICTKLSDANFNTNFLGNVTDVYAVICGTAPSW